MIGDDGAQRLPSSFGSLPFFPFSLF